MSKNKKNEKEVVLKLEENKEYKNMTLKQILKHNIKRFVGGKHNLKDYTQKSKNFKV